MTAKDIKSPARVIELNGATYRMDFDMEALAQAEQVYADHFGKPEANVNQIMTDLFAAKMSAVMAFCYGAMISAGEKVTWEDFSKRIFNFDNFVPVFKIVSAAIEGMFVGADGKTDAEIKN